MLILPLDFENQDSIINPTQYEDKPGWGVVVAVGSGRVLDNGSIVVLDVLPGDIVCFGAYSSTVVRSHGHDFFFVRQEDIYSKYAQNA